MATNDINDVFDDLLLCEDKLVQAGYDKGYQQSELSTETNAFHLGYHKGLLIGAELGHYIGILDGIIETQNLNEKQLAEAVQIKELISKFPKENSLECDFEAMLTNIRSQFKRFSINLKLPLQPNVSQGNIDF